MQLRQLDESNMTHGRHDKEIIYVTKPSLPPLDEYLPLLESIWKSRVLTNGGPFHQQFEKELCNYLGVKYISLFTNATVALITALKALSIKGDVITTPYSFVATAHALLWNECRPVFADIDPVTMNISPKSVEQLITPDVRAILAVHCYGRPCDVDTLDDISKRFNIPVIYDAAHAFGVTCHCGSVLNHGDLSVLSFHATKVFNTFEGGAIISGSSSMKSKIDQLKNFGFIDEVTVQEVGINGKMSELNAALGLIQLKHVEHSVKSREEIYTRYITSLENILGITCIQRDFKTGNNFSYFPILVDSLFPISRDSLYNVLKQNRIMSRRYFFPLISNMPMYHRFPSAEKSRLPIANDISQRILCLPIYDGISQGDVDEICTIIRNVTYA